MWDKLQKVEDIVNKILAVIFSKLWQSILSATPRFIFTLRDKVKNSYQEFYVWLRNFAYDVAITYKDYSAYYRDTIADKINALQGYPFKEKGLAEFEKFKSYIIRKPSEHMGSIKQGFKSLLYGIKNKIIAFFARFTSEQIITTTVASLLLLIGSTAILKSLNEIMPNKIFSTREPASYNGPVREYKDYYQFGKKYLKVLNIKVPIFLKNRSTVTAVTIDFGVRTNNRFTAQYLTEVEYKLRDHFYMSMEPIEATFPIESEGKQVIKNKIQEEVNKLLEEFNIEGRIIEVDILYIIAT